MSSILNALKKAEQEGAKDEQSPDLKLNVQRFFTSKTRNKPLIFFLNFKQLLFALGALSAFGILLFFVFSTGRFSPDSPSTVNITTPETQPQVLKSSEKKIILPPSIQVPIPVAQPPEKEETSKIETVSKANPIPPPEPAQPMKSVTVPHPPPQESIQGKDLLLPEESISNAPAQGDQKQNFVDIQPLKEIMEIEGEPIKVQAISWAQTPEDRIAVINNKIVAEKDFILDYRIVQIRKDEIIVERSGEKYVLRFRYR